MGVERFIMWLNCAIVGSPNAMITSMQKDSTVVSVASRSLESAEDLLIEMQLEFGIYLSECLVQHGENPPVG